MAKLKRRGTIWYAWIRGELKSTKCSSKEAAKIAADQLERAAVDPQFRAANQATLRLACDAWREAFELRIGTGERSEETLEFYRYKLAHCLRLLGEDTKLAHIDATAIDQYIAVRLRDEAAHPSSLAKEMIALRQVLKLAKRRGKFPRDLDAVFPIGMGSGYKPRETYLTPEQVRKLLAVQNPLHAVATALYVATAMRLSELARARREDVDLKAWLVRVRGTKTEDSDATIPIAPPFRELLTFACDQAPAKGLLTGPWLNMARDLESACRRADVPRVTANDLRRTHGTWLRAAGIDPKQIAPVLRHKDSRMAELVYARLNPADLGALLERQAPAMPSMAQTKFASAKASERKYPNGRKSKQPNKYPTRAKNKARKSNETPSKPPL